MAADAIEELKTDLTKPEGGAGADGDKKPEGDQGADLAAKVKQLEKDLAAEKKTSQQWQNTAKSWYEKAAEGKGEGSGKKPSGKEKADDGDDPEGVELLRKIASSKDGGKGVLREYGFMTKDDLDSAVDREIAAREEVTGKAKFFEENPDLLDDSSEAFKEMKAALDDLFPDRGKEVSLRQLKAAQRFIEKTNGKGSEENGTAGRLKAAAATAKGTGNVGIGSQTKLTADQMAIARGLGLDETQATKVVKKFNESRGK